MKTRISLVLLGLGLVSGSAYAGAVDMPMPVSNDINVTAPDQSGMWSFGATAVYMQPTGDFTYATSSTNDSLLNHSDLNYHSVDQDYQWWFGADVTYHFPGNGRDVTLAYEGLHGDQSDSTTAPDSGILSSNFSVGDFLTAEGTTDVDYDAGDLTFGQKLNVGERISLHPFMGLRYAHIDVDNTGHYTSFGVVRGTNALSEDGELETNFNGIGPRFGSDAQINLGSGFSIRGRLGLSVLIGSADVDYDIVDTTYDASGTAVSTSSIDSDHESNTRLVPEIDGRMGLNYTYNFDSNTALGFEAGWQATNYFNVVSDESLLDVIGNHHSDTSDFGMQGPYARVQLDIA